MAPDAPREPERRFTARLWRYDGPSAWYFMSLPAPLADDIADEAEGRTGGFGSVRVEVTIGGSTWQTSLFPDTRSGTYVLPVKKAVRRAESIDDGDEVAVTLTLLGLAGD